MVLHDVFLYGDPEPKHLYISGGLIRRVTNNRSELDRINDPERWLLDGALVLPGFINSHDHLDFNCYPQLGNRVYNNYTEWGTSIHREFADTIAAVQKIPQSLRVQWGLYKNLLSGFTTVVHHGNPVGNENFPVQLFQDCRCLHSPSFEKNWVRKLNNPLRRKQTVVMHIGEGTDSFSCREIEQVRKKNFLRRPIVAVHGVAMTAAQAGSFAGLVWCPATNMFLLQQTARVKELQTLLPVVFGTDSTLTSDWDIAGHFREALQSSQVQEEQLLAMLTAQPAALWHMQDRGQVREGMRADLLVLRNDETILKGFRSALQMVLINGEAELVRTDFSGDMKTPADIFSTGGQTYRVRKGILALQEKIRTYFPSFESVIHAA